MVRGQELPNHGWDRPTRVEAARVACPHLAAATRCHAAPRGHEVDVDVEAAALRCESHQTSRGSSGERSADGLTDGRTRGVL